MRKRVFPRLICFVCVSFLIFVLLGAMQFTRTGNFTQKIGDAVISGRYVLSDGADGDTGRMPLDDGATVTFGGLEFRLASLPNTENSFALLDSEGGRLQVSPEYLSFSDNKAIFTFPGGAELVFTSQNINRGQGETPEIPELQISGTFPEEISAIVIPLRPQRSSLHHEDGMLTVTYRGSRYQFNRSLQGLNDNRLILLAGMPSISYRLVPDIEVKENNPADFIVQNAETLQAYTETLARWTARNFELWVRGMPAPGDEDQVVAWCAEALRQNRYRNASTVIPASFMNGANRSWDSAVYQFDRRTGIWANAARSANARERERISRVSAQIAEKDYSLFMENKLIEFFAIRNQNSLIDDIAAFALETDPSLLTLAMCPGILENIIDMRKWRPDNPNPFEALAEQACRLVAEGLHGSDEQVFVFADGHADIEFNVRLGISLNEWGTQYDEEDWAALGRSLVISAVSLGNESGMVPASLEISQDGQLTPSAENRSTARLYRMMGNNEYLPHAKAGLNDIWVWTVASSITVTQANNMIDIDVRFPVGETHYMMFRNIRPFYQLQIYNIAYRSAFDFESYYDSPGWLYIENEQTLIVKLRHRTADERVRIITSAPPAPPRPATPPRPAPIPMPMPVPVPVQPET